MDWIRLPGSAGRYANRESGEIISRRQYEKLTRPEAIARRETTYRESRRERRAATEFIRKSTNQENKAYWRQRFAEQYAVRNGMTDTQALAIARLPGSMFNRLWAQAERQGFDGGNGTAWDAMAYAAGAKGGADDESERNKYLAVISWYTANDRVGDERWLERRSDGTFVWPDRDVA